MLYKTRAKRKPIHRIVDLMAFLLIQLPFALVGFLHQLLMPLFKGFRRR